MDEVEDLIQQLKDGIGPRAVIATRLNNIRDSRAVPSLIDLLEDDDHNVRLNAASALGNIGDARAVPALIVVLDDENAFVREAAAEALGEIGDARAVLALLEALMDRVQGVRTDAAKALDKIAEKAEIDLAEIHDLFQAFIARVGEERSAVELGAIKRKTAEVYKLMANAAAKRKQAEMPGEMLPGGFKPRKKPGIYRMRRALNG